VTSTYNTDIDDQGAFDLGDPTTWNYKYDQSGNLVQDKQEQIAVIEWTVYGKVKKVIRTSVSAKPDLEFNYDATGNRIAKIVKPHGSSVENGGTDNSALWTTTYYIRDASGNIMSTYEDRESDPGFYLDEQLIYGSSRIGLLKRNLDLTSATTPTNGFSRTLGKKIYEGGNHLGNVLATFSDRKIPVDGIYNYVGAGNGSYTRTLTGYTNVGAGNGDYNQTEAPDGDIDYYFADITSTNDYGVWGDLLPERNHSTADYRFGFNGQEKTDEISGSGNHYTADYWEYDSRTIKRWNRDKVNKPWESPYAAFSNNPIWFIDPFGLDTVEVFAETGKLKSHIETDEGDDVFFLIDKEGKRGESISFEGGTLESTKTQSTSYKDDKGKEQVTTFDIYRLRGDENATKLFEFFATNTPVEWSQIMTGVEGEKGLNFLTTAGLPGKEPGSTSLFTGQLQYGYTLRSFIHNHPNNYATPSGLIKRDKDIGFATQIEDWYMSNYKNRTRPVFKIYTDDFGYHQYNKNSTRLDFIIQLPNVIIRPAE
ncbi:MAG: hypothetical protein HYY40_04270, partial [Bacteroidetes bacterium]|nr:hypothetical protein [Bacteroidota bacterium]